MRVVWVHSFDRNSNQNSGVFMFQLLDHLRQKGWDIKEVYTGKIGLFSFFKVLRHLSKETKGYDVVHAQYGSGCGLVTSFLKGKKLLTLRGSDWYVSKKVNSFKEYIHTRLAVGMTKMSLRKYNAIITMSKKMTAELKKTSSKKKIYTVMDGIDLIKFASRSRNSARQSLGQDKDSNPWVLFSSVAENNPLKRFNLANAAYEMAKREIPNLNLKFMNGISHDKVPDFVASSNVVLLTSTHEGWPNIIKEGLSLNIPFVSTDVSDLKEIAKNEETCTVVAEDDENVMIENLAKGIVKAINFTDEYDLRKYTHEMDMNFISEELIKIYQNL